MILKITYQPKEEMKEKDSEEQVSAGENANDSRLEAVRDLLFGPNDQQYRQEFKDIKDQVSQNKKDADEHAEALKSDILERLDNLEKKVSEDINTLKTDLNKQIEELNTGKVDRIQLAKLLQNLAKELEA